MARQRFSPRKSFTKPNIEKVPEKPPVVYELLDQKGENIYTGIAKRGRGPERLREHLPTGLDPIKGAREFRVKPMPTIEEARKEEKRIIKNEEPKYNEK